MDGLAPISHQIWDMKYRLKGADGAAVDRSIEDTWKRVAKALAKPETHPAQWEPVFYDALEDFKVLPAGRILAGAGTDRKVTLFNCFVMGTIPDSMGGIFDALKEAALTMQQGGGIGYDFSTIRPKGAPVHTVGADASGPLSFMDVWDSMCRTIMSAGSRRGAMMATMRCDHPDIEAFIEAKRDAVRLRMFNLSVLITDAFMEAVKDDAPWDLTFEGTTVRTVRARELWDKIMRSTYDFAEPGVIFIDRINKLNNLWYCETISATNPCGEQPLPPYGTCLLGSVNLARLVETPFEDGAHIDTDKLDRLVRVAVRMLDNVIEVSNYPLAQQRAEALNKRRIGLGVTGLADALIMCGARYGSDKAVALIEHWMGILQRAAYLASTELAAEKGAFPLYDAEKYLAGPTVRALPEDVRQAIAESGIRNALLTSIAPTGTISLFADNVSSGLEPVFSFTYTRKVLHKDGSRTEEEVSDYAYRKFRETHGEDAELPAAFVDAQSLTPRDHLVMQAAIQRTIDSSISKTINLPEDIPFEAFEDVYKSAYEMGCKGCTTYRPNEVTGAVLSVKSEAKDDGGSNVETLRPDQPFDPNLFPLAEPLDRPELLEGRTYKIKWPDDDHATYITVNDTWVNGVRRPFEVFINSKNPEHYAWTVALTRMISAVFRRGGDISFVVEELKAVFDPRGGQWMQLPGMKKPSVVGSIVAAVGGVIEYHMHQIGFLAPDEEVAFPVDEEGKKVVNLSDSPGRSCPKCGQPTLIRMEGCDTCQSCGYSKCS